MHESQSPETPGPDGSLEPMFRWVVSDDADPVVLALHGELDLVSAPVLLRQLRLLLDRTSSAMTVDMKDLAFIDSSGLGALCQALQEAKERGIALELVNVPDHARRVLEITGLTETFNLE